MMKSKKHIDIRFNLSARVFKHAEGATLNAKFETPRRSFWVKDCFLMTLFYALLALLGVFCIDGILEKFIDWSIFRYFSIDRWMACCLGAFGFLLVVFNRQIAFLTRRRLRIIINDEFLCIRRWFREDRYAHSCLEKFELEKCQDKAHYFDYSSRKLVLVMRNEKNRTTIVYIYRAEFAEALKENCNLFLKLHRPSAIRVKSEPDSKVFDYSNISSLN